MSVYNEMVKYKNQRKRMGVEPTRRTGRAFRLKRFWRPWRSPDLSRFHFL